MQFLMHSIVSWYDKNTYVCHVMTSYYSRWNCVHGNRNEHKHGNKDVLKTAVFVTCSSFWKIPQHLLDMLSQV